MAVTIKQKPVEPMKLYRFGTTTDGNSKMKDVLGGKGANLAEMSSIGLPVPPGFTIPCEASITYKNSKSVATKSSFLNSLWAQVDEALQELVEYFGYMPLVSVRSGARVSMPGMMDTILNVGLTAETLDYWRGALGDRAALDSYRRLIQMYSSVALGVSMELFEEELEKMKVEVGVSSDSELDVGNLERLISRYLKVVSMSGHTFPNTMREQLHGAITAVFQSWDNPRAIEYRKIHGYPDDWGTAVNVQSMVFGNLNDQSATGVVFTRCPSTGEKSWTGEFLVNAQGEDVVAGIRTPEPIHSMAAWNNAVKCELYGILEKLESHYRDMQDVEFTVQNGELFILQTRNGKRSPKAAFKIAYDMAYEGMITKKEALGRVTQSQLLSVMQDTIDPKFKTPPHLVGIAAGGGVVKGVAVFTAEDAVNCKEPCILIRKETDPDDIAGMNASVGILTATGGLTSHAAVVARGMNKSCVVGATDMTVVGNAATIPGGAIHEGFKVTIDGATGNVWVGIDVPVLAGGQSDDVKTLIGWSITDDDGISERLGLTWHDTQEDMIEAVTSAICQSIYVDTAIMEGPVRLSIKELKDRMTMLGTALLSFEGGEIIIDLHGMGDYLQKPDQIFDAMFGHDPDLDGGLMVAKAEVMTTWDYDLRQKITVKLPDSSGNISGILAASGMKTMGKISTVADLLSCGGPVEVSDDTIKKVFGTKEAYQQVKTLIEEKTGKNLSGQVTTPIYWYDFLNKAA